MAENDKIPDDIDPDDPSQYEVLTHGRDELQAEQFRDLLIDHDIEAILPDPEQEGWIPADEGVPVLVPVDSIDEAKDILDEIELIEEMDIADPDFDGPVEEEEDIAKDMQPLTSDAYSLETDDDPPDLGESEEGY